MNEVSTVKQTSVAMSDDFKSMAIEYLQGMGMNIPEKYATQFIELCKAYQLNPFKRECYAVGYGDRWNIITGYEVYIKRAERTGKLDGWDCVVEGQGQQMVAKITIYRKDWGHPFHHFVMYNEAVQKRQDGSVNSMWAKMGSFMLRKVCIAQGFRLCFPDELGGMPYTSDEVSEIEQSERNITNEATANFVKPDVKKQDAASPSVSNVDDISVKFKKLLDNYKAKLGNNYDTALEAFQTGSDNEMVVMYNRCVTYLEKKGVKVA